MAAQIAGKVRKIMCDDSDIMRGIQAAVRNEMDRLGMPLKVYASDAGIKDRTFMSYFQHTGERSVMPVTALRNLCGVLPERVLSLFLPDGFQIVRAPGAVDYDLLGQKCAEFAALKNEVHGVNSPGQREISECEQARLDELAAEIAVIAGGVA